VNPSNYGTRIGADVGASLTKLAIRRGDEPFRLELAPAEAIERVAREVESLRPRRIGVTGGGGARFADLLALDTTRIGEFDAWAAGARELLRMQGAASSEPFLLVSLGTGTSALLVDGDRVERVGGTALGGGTILGLGRALTGRASFDELGDSQRVFGVAHGWRKTADHELPEHVIDVPLVARVDRLYARQHLRAHPRLPDWIRPKGAVATVPKFSLSTHARAARSSP